MDGRRPAGYWYQTKRTGGPTLDLFPEEERDDLPLVNTLREDVRRWRASGYTARFHAMSRHQLFPQVFALVQQYIKRNVDFRGCHSCELVLDRYVTRVVDLLMDAIEPDDDRGESPLLPILNRYRSIGSTPGVEFKTTRPVFPTQRSHINAVAADTGSWEQAAAFRLEQSRHVASYTRNDHLEFVIPYEFQDLSRAYMPDFLVRLDDGSTLVLEIKGYEDAPRSCDPSRDSMRKRNFALRLQPSLLEEARRLAEAEGVT